jgi:hypothetical protein
MSLEGPTRGKGFASGKPRLSVSVLPGPKSGSRVRDTLAELVADADPVALEQIAVLIGALTSGDDERGGRARPPIDLKVWTGPSRVGLSFAIVSSCCTAPGKASSSSSAAW